MEIKSAENCKREKILTSFGEKYLEHVHNRIELQLKHFAFSQQLTVLKDGSVEIFCRGYLPAASKLGIGLSERRKQKYCSEVKEELQVGAKQSLSL